MPEGAMLVPAGVLEESPPEAFVSACRQHPDHLLYFLLNVGDGDTQLLVLPEEEASDGQRWRRMIVVDVATAGKLPALIEDLEKFSVIPDRNAPGLFPIVVGTHPHDDHLGGMPDFLARFGSQIKDFWEPGYYHPSGAYVETMVALETGQGIDRLQPA